MALIGAAVGPTEGPWHPAPADRGEALGGTWVHLPLRVQVQETAYACWAAVAASAVAFYGPAVRQEAIAAKVGQALTSPARVDHALRAVRCLDRCEAGAPDFLSLRAALDGGDPVCAVIETERTVHFLLIHGYIVTAEGNWLHLADPRCGHSYHRLGDFPGNYGAGGRWTWTCWLRNPGCAIPASN